MKKISVSDKICILVTNLLGIGYSPFFPGTLASLVAVLVFLAVRNPGYYAGFTGLSIVLSLAFSSRAEQLFGEKDSKKIVIDDFSGMLITMLFIPASLPFIFCGFFLFRALDMVKIPPANIIEKCHGAKGIVGDDIIAGIYANLILHLVRLALKIAFGYFSRLPI